MNKFGKIIEVEGGSESDSSESEDTNYNYEIMNDYDEDEPQKEHEYQKEIDEINKSLQVQGYEDLAEKVNLMKKRIYALSDKKQTSKNFVRTLVSKKKSRYNLDDVDLDLTYITESIIAMGFPSWSTESFYRNPFSDVKELLEKKHKNHYRVYNLCAEEERRYDMKVFPSVKCCGFYDHHAPKFGQIMEFCEDIVRIDLV